VEDRSRNRRSHLVRPGAWPGLIAGDSILEHGNVPRDTQSRILKLAIRGCTQDTGNADGSLAVREEYDSEGRSSQWGPEGNRLVTGRGFVGLNPETMATYHLSQGDFVKTEAGWSQIQESASSRGTIEFHADYPGQFQNQRSRLKILDTRKAC
jgi:hypothetical protein